MVPFIDGNENCSLHSGDIPPIASEQPPTMAWMPQPDATDLPHRPPLTSQQSNSLPSTPYQHARNLSFHSRSPSPARGSTSPRSTHSESIHLPPSARKPLGGCKYETAMAYFRRRIPYSLGADPLPEEKEELKEKLDPEEEKKMTADIMDLYDRLLPSAESDDRRHQLVRKLEKLFNDQWPGHEIKANVFGSSGNKLCSSDSDGTLFSVQKRIARQNSEGFLQTNQGTWKADLNQWIFVSRQTSRIWNMCVFWRRFWQNVRISLF